jgi:Fungal fucose-specific lectin
MINTIASFGIGGTIPRVYWFGQGLMETGVEPRDRWYTSNLLYDQFSNPSSNSAIACFGINGQFSRVYYSSEGALVEFEFQPNEWNANNLTWNQDAPVVTSGSGITCFGLNGSLARVYYFNDDDKLIEMANISQNVPWRITNLNDLTGAPPSGPSRVIACFASGGFDARVYYFDRHGNVIELASSVFGWQERNLTALANAPAAAPISSIACFGVNGSAPRIYYFDPQQNVIELGFGDQNQWYAANINAATGAPPVHFPSGLTCFAIGGWTGRIYYFDTSMDLIELGWANNGWYYGNLATACNAPKAYGSLTCFGTGEQATRLYYLAGTPPRVWEVAFDSHQWRWGAMAVST